MATASDRAAVQAGASLAGGTDEDLYRKVTFRFIPILFICYVFNYLDRTNIGFAQLQMKGDLGLGDVAYGVGAGLFFVSYSIFALPASLLMTRIGARRAIFWSLFGSGIASAATMFVHSAREFYVLRFLLGVVEAGFFPGVIYYFSNWYPSRRRGKVIGIMTAASVVAGIVSGILSGAIMRYLDKFLALRGWQWMFLIEGVPSAILALAIYFFLDEKPSDGKWLAPAERTALIEGLARDPVGKATDRRLGRMLLDVRVYMIGLIYFLAVFGTFVLAFWQPTMIKEFGVSNVMTIGLYSTIPPIAAVIAKVYVGHHSDKKKELRWHFAVPALIGAAGFSLTTLFPHSPLLGILCLTLATAGVHGCIPMIWAAPGLYWSDTAIAGAIALISTIGTVSGAVGPGLLAEIKKATGSFNDGMYVLSAILTLAAVLMVLLVKKKDEKPDADAQPQTA